MLNINKIHSLINRGENNPSIVSRGIGINYRTLKSKLESNSWTANDIEAIADYFNKSILYFFDKEDELDRVEESRLKYINCEECISKQKEIDRLNEQLLDKNELLDFYRGKKETENGNRLSCNEDTNRKKAMQ